MGSKPFREGKVVEIFGHTESPTVAAGAFSDERNKQNGDKEENKHNKNSSHGGHQINGERVCNQTSRGHGSGRGHNGGQGGCGRRGNSYNSDCGDREHNGRYQHNQY